MKYSVGKLQKNIFLYSFAIVSIYKKIYFFLCRLSCSKSLAYKHPEEAQGMATTIIIPDQFIGTTVVIKEEMLV
jgi:hypothetical protein